MTEQTVAPDPAAVQRYADTVMRWIERDIDAGLIPASVASFVELHDYRDANVYVIDAIGADYVTFEHYGDEDATGAPLSAERLAAVEAETDMSNAITDEITRRLWKCPGCGWASHECMCNFPCVACFEHDGVPLPKPCAHEGKRCSPVAGDCLCECANCTDRRESAMRDAGAPADWAGSGYRDVSGAVGADGLVYSDADPGL